MTIETINTNEWKNKSTQDNIIILDIRTKKEHDTHKINNSINLDYYLPEFEERLGKLDKEKVYLIYCKSGIRSINSLETFQKLGFKNVYNLKNGIDSY